MMTDQEKPTIEPHKGGYMVRIPGGDYCWQPSRDFARKWLANYYRNAHGADCRCSICAFAPH